MIPIFDNNRDSLQNQFDETAWLAESGLAPSALAPMIDEIEQNTPSRAVAKAKTFALIAEHGMIAVDKTDIFQDKLCGGSIMPQQRSKWENEIIQTYMATEAQDMARARNKYGAYFGSSDFGHTSPNTRLLLAEGFAGLLARVNRASARNGLDEEQIAFYESCKIVLGGAMTVASRLSEAIMPYNPENAEVLAHIAWSKPENSYEAMQLLVLYFFLHEYVMGTRVRTLGRLDVLLTPFFRNDLANGRFTQEELHEMLKYFLNKFWVAKVPFDLPFCLGGTDENGDCVVNEVTELIVQTYDEMNIHSPKIHIRVSENTPPSFLKRVLRCIRGGNSSFVFVNDRIAIKALERVGIASEDSWDYVPIGCYEPAIWGKEIGCTGNGGVNLAKAVELVLLNGLDGASGELVGIKTGEIGSFDEFLDAVKRQIAYMSDRAVNYTVEIEKHYPSIGPDPLLSCQYEQSVNNGVDVYAGGAKYNNSSLYFYFIASLVDSLCAVKTLVYDQKLCTLSELSDILLQNWKSRPDLRIDAQRLPEKYGNHQPFADAMTVEFAKFCASLVNNRPNGRGGVFKAALFSIDRYIDLGERTMATPDGRLTGDPLSKNLCAVVGMDRRGITSLIQSVTSMDLADFPNGSVLDIMLHPSAVSGEDGLDAFFGILMTYFKKGGFAMHGNVFDSSILKEAQTNPDRYRNLQVRVCGWNAYFVNLSRAEQDAFIRQAEGYEG